MELLSEILWNSIRQFFRIPFSNSFESPLTILWNSRKKTSESPSRSLWNYHNDFFNYLEIPFRVFKNVFQKSFKISFRNSSKFISRILWYSVSISLDFPFCNSLEFPKAIHQISLLKSLEFLSKYPLFFFRYSLEVPSEIFWNFLQESFRILFRNPLKFI